MRQIALALMMVSLCSAAPVAARECDRACAILAAEAAFAALQSGQPGKALPRGVRITENGRDIRPADSQLFAIRRISARQTFAEAPTGTVGMTGAGDAWGGPAIFAVRVKLKGDRVNEIETLVVRRTEAAAFAPEAFRNRSEVGMAPPPGRRASRADLVAIADAWLDAQSSGAARQALASANCVLIENGVGSSSSRTPCISWGSLKGPLRDRRSVLIDEEQGLVWAWAMADDPDTPSSGSARPISSPRSALMAARLRIEGGLIVEIEVIRRDLPLGAPSGWAPSKPKRRS